MARSLPLSFGQQRLWLVDQFRPRSTEYLIRVGWRLVGVLDVGALRGALSALVARHEALRTRLVAVDGSPAQVIDDPGELDLELTDLSGADDARLRVTVAEVAAAPFDLAAQWPLRARLFRLAAGEHLLVLVFHHAACDGWSLDVLARDLGELYRCQLACTPADLPDLPVQYADFAQWQHARAAAGELAADLGYWRGQLAGLEPLELHTDRPRPRCWNPGGGTVEFRVPPAVTQALANLGRSRGATLYMTVLTAFLTLLARYTGRTDLAVGTPVAGRSRREVKDLIGFFINTVIIRADLPADLPFPQALDQIRATCLDAYAHQDLPFERIVEELAPHRDLSRNPLFQILFEWEEVPGNSFSIGPLRATSEKIEWHTSKLDLTLSMIHREHDELYGVITYASALFDHATAERMAGHFKTLLKNIADSPGTRR